MKRLSNNQFNAIRSVLGVTPGYALQKNGVIWVEGPSDSIYIKTIMKCFKIDLDLDNVIIIPYNGRTFIEKEHISLDLMESTNPNFMVLVDSDYDRLKTSMDGKLQEFKNKFENAGYDFFVIDKRKDIEGLIPQEILNEYFQINLSISQEDCKQPFEKLEDYIKRIKTKNLTKDNSPGFNKVSTAYQISNLIEKNEILQEIITKDSYIKEIKDTIIKNLKRWILNPVSKLLI